MTLPSQCRRCGAILNQDAALDVCPRCVALYVLSAESGAMADDHFTSSTKQDPSAPEGDCAQRVGPYKILQKIGEGGCGVVYMAEQEEPVRRRVAVKIVKLGMDTRQVVARFEAERQALAMMDHPNIAKVLDAGATAAGRPYFVMELVRGVRINQYCDEANLNTSDRLKLFTQVCQAVQHAHQKGIIHRDLKPSNVLVTINDGMAVPKVIDFGIAKAFGGQQLTNKTLFTAFEQFIGTPAYMSPEQAMMTSLDIDTRSDIYSLGVLLYELLTGKTPFDQQELLQPGLDAFRRTIQEQEPPRPSARLSTFSRADLTTAAKRRSTDVPRLIHAIQGDLDWIAMKCLEKDRRRRYESASGLAADIERHLVHEPVLARPPSSLYKLRKAIRRNRVFFAATGAVSLALVLGLCIAGWQYVKKNEAYQQAQTEADNARREAAKSEQVISVLYDMLHGAGPLVAQGRDTTILREILDNTANRLDKDFVNQPEVEADLRETLGFVYDSIREFDKAEEMVRKALAVRKQLHGHRSLKVADTLNQLAGVLGFSGKNAEAEQHLREALSIRQSLTQGSDVEMAWLLSQFSIVLERQGKLEEAEKYVVKAIALKRQLLPPNDLNLAMSLVNLGNVRGHQDKLLEAEAAYREALSIFHNIPNADTMGNALSLKHVAAANLADVLHRQRRYAAMDEPLALAAVASKRLYGEESPEAIHAIGSCGGILLLQGKYGEADQLIQAELEKLSSEVARLRLRVRWWARRENWKEAAVAASRLVELKPEEHLRYHDLAPLLVQIGDVAGYRELCQQEVAKFADTPSPNVAERMAKDCLILAESGVDWNALVGWTDLALEGGKDSADLPSFQFAKSLLEYRRGRCALAIEWAKSALTKPDEGNRDVEATAVLAMAQWQLNQVDEARATFARVLQLQSKLPKGGSGDVGAEWLDWIIAQTLVREAGRLIEGETPNSAVVQP